MMQGIFFYNNDGSDIFILDNVNDCLQQNFRAQ